MDDPIEQIARELAGTPYFGPRTSAIADALRAQRAAGQAEAQSQIEALTARNAELCSAHNALLADGARWQSRAEAAEATGRAEGRAALHAAIARIINYRQHLTGCEINQTDFCSCGLREAMDGLDAEWKTAALPAAPGEAGEETDK